MTKRDCYLLVEGQQDVAFIGRLFQELGLRFVQDADDLPQKWQPLVDEALRQRDQALRDRGREGIGFWQIFRQTCLVGDSHSIVIERAAGNRTQFGRTLVGTGNLIDGGLASLFAIALMPDADTDGAASFASAQEALRAAGVPIPLLAADVVGGPPRTGIFVLPGVGETGGLEELLIDCAAVVYPDLLAGAQTFVGSVAVDSPAYSAEDMREMRTPQGAMKAVIGSMASVLKPGATIQVSIQRDRWLSSQSAAVGRVAALVAFLRDLCGIG